MQRAIATRTRRLAVPKGWIILALALACWGLVIVAVHGLLTQLGHL